MNDHLDGCELEFKTHALDDAAILDLFAELDAEVAFSQGALGDAAVGGGDDIAAWLRAEGLDVVEVPGWRTRGRDFAGVAPVLNAKGAVNHHTAGPPDAAGRKTPSLGICVNGRSDLPGPLCNVYLGFDRKVYVVAAGTANHAGRPDGGVCRGMRGNSDAYGLEIEHPGTFPLPPDMVKIAAKIHAALARGKGYKAGQVVQHHEWAPSRKIDLATNMHGINPGPSANSFRSMIEQEMAPPPRWRYELINKEGAVVDFSEPAVEAKLKERYDTFTARVRGKYITMLLNKRGPKIRAVRV